MTREDCFEQIAIAQGYTKEMADCAMDQAAQNGMSPDQLIAEYDGMLSRAIPDAMTPMAYDALVICGVHP